MHLSAPMHNTCFALPFFSPPPPSSCARKPQSGFGLGRVRHKVALSGWPCLCSSVSGCGAAT
eukprot:4045334-Pleurochrysis_carterae.AAC.1